MPNPTIDGIEVASQADVTALEAKVAAIPAPTTPFDPSALNAEITSLQSGLTSATASISTLQSSMTALQATVSELSAPTTTTTSPSDSSLDARLSAVEQILANAKAAFDGSTVASTGGTGTTGGGTTTTKNPFPLLADGVTPDLVNATVPSPEGSFMTVINGKPAGDPYLMTKNRDLVQWVIQADGTVEPVTSEFGSGYVPQINGVSAPTSSGMDVTKMEIAQGTLYLTARGGVSGVLESPASMASGFVPQQIPPLWTAGTTSAPLPTMPADPVAISPAPGTVGSPVLFGAKQTATTLTAAIASAVAGGSVTAAPEAAGATFSESPLFPAFALALDGGLRITGGGTPTASVSTLGALIAASSLADPTGYAHQLGGLVPVADANVMGFDISGFGMQEAGSGGTGGLRNGAAGVFSASHLYLHGNQMGLSQGGFACDWTLTDALLVDNGIGDGSSHNIYLSNNTVRATILRVTSIVNPQSYTNGVGEKAKGGHAVKLRSAVTTITDSYLYASDETCYDQPDGSTKVCVITNTTFEKKAGDLNHGFISYGTENGAPLGLAGLSFVGCTFKLGCDSPLIVTTGPITFDSACKFLDGNGNPLAAGSVTVQGGGTVTGLP